MNVTFRPFDPQKDKELIAQFLIDTKKSTGTLPEDSKKDCDSYISAIILTQERNPTFCVVIMDDDKDIGFLDIFPLKKNPEIGFLRFDYLIESYRGKGLGNILMDYVNKMMKENKCKKVLLDVAKDNKRAIAFYQKHGFKFTENETELNIQMIKDL